MVTCQYGNANAAIVLVQAVGDHDMAGLDFKEPEFRTARAFAWLLRAH